MTRRERTSKKMDDEPTRTSYTWLVVLICAICLGFLAYRRKERWLNYDSSSLAGHQGRVHQPLGGDGAIGHGYQ